MSGGDFLLYNPGIYTSKSTMTYYVKVGERTILNREDSKDKIFLSWTPLNFFFHH